MTRDDARAAGLRAYQKAWREANPERTSARKKAWREANPEQVQAGRRRWREANPEVCREYAARRRAYEQLQCPPWVDRRAILTLYLSCPPGQEVDHIIPLRGKTVWGLHVPWNLQYLLPVANKTKGNRLIYVEGRQPSWVHQLQLL